MSNQPNPTTQSAYTGCTAEAAFSTTANTKNQIALLTYDAAGNTTTCQNYMSGAATCTYDAENHITQFSWAGGSNTYTYDGDGNRVMKSGSPGTIYWYGAGSDALIETDLSNNVQAGYAYFNGQRALRILPTNEVGFYFSDHLGNTRYFQSLAGDNVSDFYPFGGERVYSGGNPTHYKFTGKERDSESGLDNFGARYNSSSMGRFMSPDAFYKDSHVGDPQSWNEYAYARNNPLRYVDPTGEKATVSTTCTTDANNQQTCNVSVSATIAIYAVDGSNLTANQLNAAASAIKGSIESAWSGSFQQDGVTYNVSTQVSVQLTASLGDAMDSGAQNVIGLSNSNASGSSSSFVDPGIKHLGMGPDTGIWNYKALAEDAPHEFSHLLGMEDRDSGDSITNHLEQHPVTSADLKEAFGGVVSSFSGLYDTVTGDTGGLVQHGGQRIMAPGSGPQTLRSGLVNTHSPFHHWWH